MLEWIISSSVLIAIVIALRLLLKGKISLRLQYALWVLVLVRLLLPLSVGSSSMSIMNRVEDSQVYQDVIELEFSAPVVVIPNQPTGTGTIPPVTNTGTPPVTMPNTGTSTGNTGDTPQGEQSTPSLPETPVGEVTPPVQEAPVDEAEDGVDWLTVLRRVWLGGGALLMAWLLLTNLLFAAKLRKNRVLLQRAHKLPVYVCDSVDTPCLFGFFRPAVYLTSEVASDERTMHHALEHETTHYRHGDHIWSVLRCVCLAVHWYNPLVWCAAILSKIDAELACDESTIRRLGEGERAEYGRTLLRLTYEKRTAIMTTATTMTGSGKVIKERIALIVKKPKMALYTLIAVLVIAAVAIVCTFTGAEDKTNNTKLWPEDAVISCARFEYAGDEGYKLITSEVSQFDSLQHMNLIPVEGEFEGEVIYRLVLNWNEVATNETEYIILVSENYLSVNGQFYQPDGFDFSEILSYFEGKYRYFDYELLYDEEHDDGNGSGEIEISEEIAYVLNLLETLTVEDVTGYSANMQADTEILVPLVNAAAATYVGEYDVVDEWEWFVDLHLAERSDDSGYNPEVLLFRIGISEGIVDVHCRLDANADPSDYVEIRLHSEELWNYIFSLYNPDGIDQHALSMYEDILAEHARWKIEEHNTTMVERGFPELTGFEITYLRLVDSFHYTYAFRVYRFGIAYLTDDPNPGQYVWPQDAEPDEQGRIRGYDLSIYFIAAHAHDDIVDYRFFQDCEAYWLPVNFHMDIVSSFTGEQFYLDYTRTEDGGHLYTREGASISIPYDFEHQVEVHKDSDTWCYGLVMSPTYYFENPYLTDQALFNLFHICEYGADGSGLIFSIRRYTEEEYQTMYLNSNSRQQVFARDENYYYCVFIPTQTSDEDPERAAIIAAIFEQRLEKILDDMIERNGWQAYDGENDQFSAEEGRARALIKNFATLTAEDIKYIPGFMGTNYSDVAVLLNDLAEYRIEPFESEASHWSMTLYLSGSEDNFNRKNDAWLTIYADGEESHVYILYHSKLDVYTQMYFDYPALHQYLRKRYKTDDVIDTEALSHYRDIIEAKAEHTIEVRNSNFDTKFSGYEIVAFHEIATFERDGMTYTVYEWDVGYITDRNNMNYPWTMNRVWVDSELRIRGYDSDPYLVIRSRNGREEHAFFPWDTPLYGYDEEFELAYDEIAAYFVPETDTKSYTEAAPGILLSENLASLPDAVISYAVDYVQTMVKHYNDVGAYSSGTYSSNDLYRIIEARITNIEQIPTGAVGLTDGINLYRLSYRLLADQPENIMLAGGMTMDGDWLTEWGSTGQPYLLMRVDWSGGEDIWTRICVTNTDVIMTDYGTPEMLERYDDPYLAASIELYHQYLQENTAELFSLLGHTDGAGSEDLSYELYQAFQAAPRDFIGAAAELSDDDLAEMAQFLVYYAGYFDLVNFRNQVISCGDDMLTDSEQRVIEKILQRVDEKLHGAE